MPVKILDKKALGCVLPELFFPKLEMNSQQLLYGWSGHIRRDSARSIDTAP